MKKSIDIFVIPLAMTCLVMILLSGCSNNDSHIIPSQGYAMASEHLPRCNILFMSNFSHILSVNGGNFTNYDNGLCVGDELRILYQNNSGYRSYFTVVNVPYDYRSNVFSIDESGMSKSGNLSMIMWSEGGYYSINDSYPVIGDSVNLVVEIHSMDNLPVPFFDCAVDYSDDARINSVDVFNDDGRLVIQETGMRPRIYDYQTLYSWAKFYDVNNHDGQRSIRFVVLIQGNGYRPLSGNSVRIACYSKEWFYDSRTNTIRYFVEDSYGNLLSQNVLDRRINITR